MNNVVALFTALRSARHGGKAESITLVSQIRARRRVQLGPNRFAPSTGSLNQADRLLLLVVALAISLRLPVAPFWSETACPPFSSTVRPDVQQVPAEHTR